MCTESVNRILFSNSEKIGDLGGYVGCVLRYYDLGHSEWDGITSHCPPDGRFFLSIVGCPCVYAGMPVRASLRTWMDANLDEGKAIIAAVQLYTKWLEDMHQQFQRLNRPIIEAMRKDENPI